jgi:hypothetical protein
MGWYGAHAIMYIQLTDGSQDSYPVYENVFLVQAETPDEARDKAAALARREEGDDRGTLRSGGRPAKMIFGSIRKVVSVSHESPDNQIGHGDEITYSEFIVADRSTLERLLKAEDVNILYVGKANS